MNFIGVDLHKKSITICVMDEKRKALARKGDRQVEIYPGLSFPTSVI